MTDFNTHIKEYADLAEKELERFLNLSGLRQQSVIEAMKYSVSAGGKRIRPVLVLEFCRVMGGDVNAALPYAAAIEMIHTYSLIHDDLPCMDNDDMRRGKPSCHIAFGESTALLAGDGLLTMAFGALASSSLGAEKNMRATAVLSEAAGVKGMIGGQVIDLDSEGKKIDLDTLLELDSLKTGALLRCAARLGCIAADADEESILKADRYASGIGLAFQITDDILDVTSTEAELGKPIGSDKENDKSTFVSIYGLSGAKAKADELTKSAINALDGIQDIGFLKELALRLTERKN